MMDLRRTKIVATLGPATDDESVLAELLSHVNCVRLNFSHGHLDDHAQRVRTVRKVSAEMSRDIAIFADLQGPKIRIGHFIDGSVMLNPGAEFILDLGCDPHGGTEGRVWFDYSGLLSDVAGRESLFFLLDDGRIKLRVQSQSKSAFVCEVIVGGVLSNRKGISVLGGGICAPMLTDKDLTDLDYACSLGVDMIALSFPACGDDILRARELIDAHDPSIGIISKIERREAVDHLEDIVMHSDVIMVARGDLALEVGEEEVPVLQKHMIKLCRVQETPVIVATQMMESMVTAATPTRAEVSDVANAVLDGADCVMLSAETATGNHPVGVVEKVAMICRRIEAHSLTRKSDYQDKMVANHTQGSIAYAAMYLANRMPVKAVVAVTEQGQTPRIMSRVRSGIPIYALSRLPRSRAKMTFLRDVYPLPFDMSEIGSSRQLVTRIVMFFREQGILNDEDCFLLTHGDDLSGSRATSTLKVCRVADVLSYGCDHDASVYYDELTAGNRVE
jgi:pyruvate kinase